MKDLNDIAQQAQDLEAQLKVLFESTESAIVRMADGTRSTGRSDVRLAEINNELLMLLLRTNIGHTMALQKIAENIRELAGHALEQRDSVKRVTTLGALRPIGRAISRPLPEERRPDFEELPLNGLRCEDCGEPQRDTLAGPTCTNGHGGALGVP